MLIKIANRNIWRNAKRSLIIMTAVCIGLWAGIFMMAFYNGLIDQRINTAITTELSHIQIHHPEFRKEYEIKYPLIDGREILKSINQRKEIKAASGRIIIKGMVASASGSSGITINGIVPSSEKALTKLDAKITEGSYFNPDKKNQILLSERLSKKLKLNLNKKVILTFQDTERNLTSAAFRIVGLFKTVNSPYDDTNVFVDIKDVDGLAGLPNEFNEIAILLHSNDQLIASESSLKENFPNAEIKNWKEISPELGLTVSVGDQMVYIFVGIILLALAFGIVNTMMMAVIERTREIGMLLALGMNKMKIFLMITIETFILILMGCSVGILLALITVAITNNTGINFSDYSATYASFGYDSIIYPKIKLHQLGIVLLLVFIAALLSALYPARRALRLNPAKSLKH